MTWPPPHPQFPQRAAWDRAATVVTWIVWLLAMGSVELWWQRAGLIALAVWYVWDWWRWS